MSEEGEKKIIIDEDWKTQVEAERSKLRDTESSDSPTSADAASEEDYPIPPASFPFLVQSIMTQALMAMGQIPDPIDNKPVVRLDLAKHHVDMLSVLEEKTKGNLDQNEAQMLEELLHQLRMAYVAMKGNA